MDVIRHWFHFQIQTHKGEVWQMVVSDSVTLLFLFNNEWNGWSH